MAKTLPLTTEQFVSELTGCQGRLYSYVASLLGNREQARDVVQETNLVLWRRAGDFQTGTNFMAWALTIAHFQILAYRQRVAREKLIFNDELLGQLQVIMAETHSDDFEEYQKQLADCVKKLPPQHQDVLRNRYAEGNSAKSISVQLKRSTGSVAMLLHRIRVALMNCVEHTFSSDQGSAPS